MEIALKQTHGQQTLILLISTDNSYTLFSSKYKTYCMCIVMVHEKIFNKQVPLKIFLQ